MDKGEAGHTVPQTASIKALPYGIGGGRPGRRLENCLARVRIEEVNLVCVHVQRYAAANVRS